jgi:hypothetical protein
MSSLSHNAPVSEGRDSEAWEHPPRHSNIYLTSLVTFHFNPLFYSVC